MNQKLASYCDELAGEFDLIPTDRQAELKLLSQYFSQQYEKQVTPKAIVICTHNSRRSHMGQLWLAVAANYYDKPALLTYSGGTEATAFNPRAVRAIQAIGFEVNADDTTATNPRYQIRWKGDQDPYLAFSKKYNDSPNPTENFAAIMVCTEADAGCPIVEGADFRIALPFYDPKAFDDTPLEAEKYAERCRQIGREMFFVLANV